MMCVLCAGSLGSLIVPLSFAAPQTGPLEDSLLSRDLDDLLKELPGAEPAPPLSTPSPGEDVPGAASEPLSRIASSMTNARVRIRQGQPSREVQQQVISDLDALIRQAEKQCQQCQNPSDSKESSKGRQKSQRTKSQPNQQAGNKQQAGQPQQGQQAGQRSTMRLGKADPQTAEGKPPTELMKAVWGRLPDRLREQMLESSTEEFLPEYRQDIQDYFRRLAEEPEN